MTFNSSESGTFLIPFFIYQLFHLLMESNCGIFSFEFQGSSFRFRDKKKRNYWGFGIKGLFFEVPMFMTLSEVTLPRRKKFRLGYNLG